MREFFLGVGADVLMLPSTLRPGSFRSTPGPTSRPKYMIRVGNLEISCDSPWATIFADFQLLEVESLNQQPQPVLTELIFNFETAIKAGHGLARLLSPYCRWTDRSTDSIVLLYERLSVLSKLCASVGAVVCQSTVVMSDDIIKRMSK